MISADAFWANSLRRTEAGESITRILAAGIRAADPGTAMRNSIQRIGNLVTISGQVYNLDSFHRIFLLGIGKASISMAIALVEIMGDRLSSNLVVAKHMDANHPTGMVPLTCVTGDHPIPGEASLRAGEKVIDLVSSLGSGDLLFCLISGGGSSMAVAPKPGISLEDMQALTYTLLGCGASVDEMNAIRRRIDRIKGGGLVPIANGANIVSLILSDVIGNDPGMIASGPTTAYPSTRADTLSIIKKYQLQNKIPISILNAIQASKAHISKKPGAANVQNVIIGSNLQAARAALAQAEKEGFHSYLLRADLHGEARLAAFELATCLRQAKLTGELAQSPACIIAGGETTVKIKGSGKGGRNTELALAAVTELANFNGVMLATLATDGEDGPTDAAGAVVTGETYRRALDLGMNPGDYLERNDSYSFFKALEDLLKPGPTGTNVNDLVFLITL
jgi:glycerate 2-kinase